tara:strand:- start:317 stop:628 length:312 start_codon:yes stop_codon:yes gene_type:complete
MSNINIQTALDKIAKNNDLTDAQRIHTPGSPSSTFTFTSWCTSINKTILYTWYPITVVGTNPDNLSGSGNNLKKIEYLAVGQLKLTVKYKYDLLDRIYEINTY